MTPLVFGFGPAAQFCKIGGMLRLFFHHLTPSLARS
jgi:hypothetical protein